MLSSSDESSSMSTVINFISSSCHLMCRSFSHSCALYHDSSCLSYLKVFCSKLALSSHYHLIGSNVDHSVFLPCWKQLSPYNVQRIVNELLWLVCRSSDSDPCVLTCRMMVWAAIIVSCIDYPVCEHCLVILTVSIFLVERSVTSTHLLDIFTMFPIISFTKWSTKFMFLMIITGWPTFSFISYARVFAFL